MGANEQSDTSSYILQQLQNDGIINFIDFFSFSNS